VFIAVLDLSTAPADRATALAQLVSEQPVVRAMPGCLDYRVFASHERATDVTVLHEWADEPSFAAYLASDAFARSGAVLRPLVTSAPTSRRFRLELVDTVR
jgi:quinol monooxygenase YgiN